jgi:DNA-binding NtrC family response regulator
MRGIDAALRNLYKELGVGSILLIEDDPWNRDSLSMFFRVVGCGIRSAENATEAIAALSGDRFDLILCEVQLPDMNGLTLLKSYGMNQAGAVKFLFTSHPDQGLIEEAVRSGIHEVIRKPLTVDALEESLKRWFPRVRDGGREPVGVE